MIARMFLLAGCLIGFGGGCSRQSGFLDVQGSVSLDGAPLEEGAITFSPLGSGRSAGGAIRAGRFSLSPRDGLAAGRYRVEISSYQATGSTVVDEDLANREQPVLRQVIPSCYNDESTLEAELHEGGENRLEYSLSSGAN
jgi:hypothetical protein